MSDSQGSYRQILRSSTIIGGAHAINYLISLVRVKLIAVLLGPAGVGLVSLYQSAIGLVGSLSGLGIGNSGVREVAHANGTGDAEAVARTIKVLKRACWATGLLGWLLVAGLAFPLSQLTFKSDAHTLVILLLGSTLLIGAITGGQGAVLQGMRRVGDLARISVVSASINTIIAVLLYFWLGQEGIVAVLIVSALVQLALTWWYVRKVKVAPITLGWRETINDSRRLASLGLAFMWGGLLTAGVDFFIRSSITQELGMDATGFYQAAWALSGLFAGFILSAMGTDFYPRLTAIAHDHVLASILINEQTEIGILLSLTGLIATMAFAPWLMHIFYTDKFLPGSELLPWFVIGIFGRVISWPLGFIQLAKGATRWFAATETAFNGLHLFLVWVSIKWLGLWGVALAFAVAYGLYCLGMRWVAGTLIHFKWNTAVHRLMRLALVMVITSFVAQEVLSGALAIFAGAVLTLISAVFSLRGLVARLGPEHWLTLGARRIPGSRLILGS